MASTPMEFLRFGVDGAGNECTYQFSVSRKQTSFNQYLTFALCIQSLVQFQEVR